MPAPKGRYPPARYNLVPEESKSVARASAGCAGPSGPGKLLLRQLTGGTANHANKDRDAGGHRRRA